jgi:hypothetical protein
MDVAQDQVGEMLPGHFEACDTGISFDDVIAVYAESHAERCPQLLTIIDK